MPLATRHFAALLAGWLLAAPAAGDAWVDPHDDPATAWEIEADGVAERLKQARMRLPAAAGSDDGVEQIAYLAPAGYAARAWRTVPPAALIDELRIRVRGKSTTPGVSLAAEVVAPRTRDEQGEPVRLLLRTRPVTAAPDGRFEVVLDQAPGRLAAEARVWRLTHPDMAKSLDLRGAYLDRVALLLPGAGRPAQAWISQLEVDSLVTPAGQQARQQAADAEGPALAAADPPRGRLRRTAVTLRSEGFRIDGELFYPRVWRSHGEPFGTLASRGVNTVWLDHTATPQELAEAAQHRLRVLCPPPGEATPSDDWQRVLAWVLPGSRDEHDLDTGLVELEAIQRLAATVKRPVLVHLTAGASAWARSVDGMILASAPHTADTPPGVPVLATARLDLRPRVAAQLDTLLGGLVTPTWLTPTEVSNHVEQSLATGSIGVVFTAAERIDSADDATIAAAEWLEAINRRLRLIEPWLAGPRTAAPVAPDASALLLQRGDARLALRGPLQAGPLRASDLPNDGSVRPMRLTPAGLSLQADRPGVVGDALPGDLLLASDPRVVRSLRRYTARTAQAAAENLGRLAAAELASSDSLDEGPREAAKAQLSAARLALSRRDPAAAYDKAYAALAIVAETEIARARLSHSNQLLESSPLTRLPSTLTEHFRLTQLLAASPRGPNRLHGGSFEDIDAIRSAGWRRPAASDEGATAELSEAEAIHGDRVLRLTSRPGTATHITGPAIDLTEGEVVEITGWVRTPQARGGLLEIEESLGGPSLALSVNRPLNEWTPFRLLRAAPSDTSLELTIRVSGGITAEIDGVMIRAVEPLGVARRPSGQAK